MSWEMDDAMPPPPPDDGKERRLFAGRWVTRAELDELIRQMVADGTLERCGTKNGKPAYRFTKTN